MGSILQKEGKEMWNKMWFEKGDLVTIRLPKNAMPFVWVQDYVIVDVTPAMSETILGSYEVRAIVVCGSKFGVSDESENFFVCSDSAFGIVRDESGNDFIIEDTDEYNWNNSPYNN